MPRPKDCTDNAEQQDGGCHLQWPLSSPSLLPRRMSAAVRMEWMMSKESTYPSRERIRLLAEIGLSVALATVLGMLKVWQMPMGGEVSLAMLPLFVLAFRRGFVPGLVAGALYGVVDGMLNLYVVHWVQYLLDYPVAYAGVGLAGLAASALRRGSLTVAGRTALLSAGTTLGALARYASHTISGVVFFSEYAPEGQPVWLYSAGYNSYVLVSAVICLAAALAIVPALERVAPVIREA